MTIPDKKNFKYDVALSFAGEDRAFAEQLAKQLISKGVKVFYDYNEQASLWGKDLAEHLPDIYSNQSHYCLMVISKFYANKNWPRLERRNVEARAFKQQEEYILPIHIDDSPVPGIPDTLGYVDARHLTIDQIANLVLQKLSIKPSLQPLTQQINTPQFGQFNIPLPKVKKQFSQLEKDNFIEETYEVVKRYFQQGLAQIEITFPNIKTALKEINSQKFIARIYLKGDLKCQCKIWLGSPFSTQSIGYLEGNRADMDNDNSMNDYLMVDDSTGDLSIKLSSMSFMVHRPPNSNVSMEQAAEFLWKRYTSYLHG